VLELQKVTVQYGGFTAVEDITFAGRSHPEAGTTTDLANLKIGITSAGSSTEEMVKFLFKKNGLDPAAAQTVAVGSGGAWPAGGFYVPADFVQQNPRTTQAMARAKMPNDEPTNVLETLKAADTQTDWSKVDLSKTFTNPFVEAVK
jgi:hypothetical protein